MKRLITFGCSLTFGTGLPDVWPYEKLEELHAEDIGVCSNYSWPVILAKKMNMQCINSGVPGASNKQIWYNIVNFEFKKDDVVIILWTWYDRWCVFSSEKLRPKDSIDRHMPTDKIIKKVYWWEKNNMSKIFFKYIYSRYDMVTEFYSQCNFVKMYLQNKVENVYHIKNETYETSSNEWTKFEKYYDDYIPTWNNVDFLPVDPISKIYNLFPLADDNCHPGVDAHEHFANIIFSKLNENAK